MKNAVFNLLLFIGLAAIAILPGCQCARQIGKNWESQTVGIQRITMVYDYNGHMLGKWESQSVIDADSGGLTTFFDSTGNRVLVNGGILISVEH